MKSLLLAAMLTASVAYAQTDPAGEWAPRFHEDQPERIPGPEIGDYCGLPINNAARLRGDAWDASLLTVPEHQCKPHPSDYSPRGPANLRITKEIDRDTQQLVAYHTHISWEAPERTIWMDGRPHPPAYAAHTWQGFSTGKWEGDMLTITTTHLKIGWIRRNGIPRSDKATVVEHWIRHEKYLTWVVIINDPVYLTEPFIRTTDFVADPDQEIAPYPCEIVVEIQRPKGTIPHHLPGTNPFLTEFADRHGLPHEAARGGAETMYPEYREKMAGKAVTIATAAPQPPPAPPPPDPELHVAKVQGNISMLVGAGGNITLQTGRDGVLMVDAGLAPQADKVFDAMRKVAGTEPLRYIIDTHVHADHVGGNEALGKKGNTIAGGNVVGDIGGSAAQGATIIAHEEVLNRMSATPAAGQPATPFGALPTDTYVGSEKDMFFNGEGIELLHQPAAHTDGDTIVFFRRSDVVSAGDIFTPERYPIIDVDRGGNVQGVIDGLNLIIDLTIPAEKQEGGTMVVPGHGRICDEADVVEYRDMLTIVRDRFEDMVKKGMTLDQVKAAKPTEDYDPLYGNNTRFVEAVYRSLKPAK